VPSSWLSWTALLFPSLTNRRQAHGETTTAFELTGFCTSPIEPKRLASLYGALKKILWHHEPGSAITPEAISSSAWHTAGSHTVVIRRCARCCVFSPTRR
jgi:hypothetical protein